MRTMMNHRRRASISGENDDINPNGHFVASLRVCVCEKARMSNAFPVNERLLAFYAEKLSLSLLLPTLSTEEKEFHASA